MIAEAFLKERREKGRREGLVEADKKWRQWYERNLERMKDTEPPPKPEED